MTTPTQPNTAHALAAMDTKNHPDPRTLVVVLLVFNTLLLGVGGFLVTVLIGVFSVLALATIGKPRVMVGALVWMVGTALLFLLPLYGGENAFLAVLSMIGYWANKFAVTISLGIYAINAIRPGELIAALNKIRAPQFIVIPVAVMLRFFPVVRQELTAVVDALSLRGVKAGPQLIWHPLRTIEYLLVPLLSSCSRIADDLAAASLVRGLGSPKRPSTIWRLGFGWQDMLWLAALAIVLVVHIAGWDLGI